MLEELSAKLQEEKRSADEQISTLSVKLTTAQEEIDVQNVSKLSVKKCYYNYCVIVFVCNAVLKYKEGSLDLKLEIGKLLTDLEQSQEEMKVYEREKTDLVTAKLS